MPFTYGNLYGLSDSCKVKCIDFSGNKKFQFTVSEDFYGYEFTGNSKIWTPKNLDGKNEPYTVFDEVVASAEDTFKQTERKKMSGIHSDTDISEVELADENSTILLKEHTLDSRTSFHFRPITEVTSSLSSSSLSSSSLSSSSLSSSSLSSSLLSSSSLKTGTVPPVQIYTSKTFKYFRIISGFTLVTALLDIGRGDWWEYRRPLEKYYTYLENILRLKVNLVIFVNQKSVEHVSARRKFYGLERLTKVIPISLQDLPLYRYIEMVSEIISNEQRAWNPQWDSAMRTHPEAKSPEYDILVSNPFNSRYFAWLDAGYGHGNRSVFPVSFQWQPTFVPGKVSVIKVTSQHDNLFSYKLADLYRKNWAVISGGFLGSDIYTINRFYMLHHHLVVDFIYRGLIDDDQTSLVLLIQQHPSLFHIVHGDWFDAFRLFP
ncbi:unnamed protein product [Thelazia callipaeda]|uniref:MNNL domain-containing protein n=1 Tax=Thelazia callipaeda TaxID=103827 RepID=A0A0N5CS60_THECL|nr:unnamed protein product [Thelazia callipaeda]